MVVTGNGYLPSSPVEVRWGSSSGPVLASLTASAKGNFSTSAKIPDASPGVYTVMARALDDQGYVAGQAVAAFQVTAPPTLTLTPTAGTSSTVMVQGSLFGDGAVELRWGSAQGALLGSTTGPEFDLPVSIPSGARGRHTIVATGRDPDGTFFGRASAEFDVPVAYPGPGKTATARDTVGPAIAAAALSAANRNRTVSRRGYVTLFCGRYVEAGVTGACGARSVRRLRPAGRARRGALLRLRDKSFRAPKGEPVRVRFRLSRKALASLRRARKVGMRGRVVSRDSAGNETRVGFRFSLKAPRPRQRARSSGAGTSW